MSTKTIDQFYPAVNSTASSTIESEPISDDSTKKRTLSDSSPVSTNESPANKRRAAIFSFDGEEQIYEMPDDAPVWVPLLFQSFDKMTQRMVEMTCKVDEIGSKFDDFRKDVNTQITEFKSEIDKKVDDLDESVKFIDGKFDDQQKEIDNLKKELKNAIEAQRDATDALEQYSRRNCALLHGVPEADKEDTDALFRTTVAEHLGVAVKDRDLDRTHRIGPKRSDGSARPIIAKFARYNVRAAVFRQKKKFKGTGFVITESLTKRRVAALNEARDKYGKTNVWTSDGEILVSKDKKTVNVRNL